MEVRSKGESGPHISDEMVFLEDGERPGGQAWETHVHPNSSGCPRTTCGAE